MKSKLLLLLLFAYIQPTLASPGIGFRRDYDNVRVLPYNESHGEENLKAYIIAQLASVLAKELKYTKPIYLESLSLALTAEKKPTKYQVSVQNYKYSDEENEPTEKLLIMQDVQKYNFVETLKLVEFAIKNNTKIKKQQRLQKGTRFYDRGKDMLFVDESVINEVLRQPTSKAIAKVLKTRIERPFFEKIRPDFTYYWQDGLYYIGKDTSLYKSRDTTIRKNIELDVLLTLPDIYQLNRFQQKIVVFDSDSSFFFVNSSPYHSQDSMKAVSSRQIIEDIGERDMGKKVTLMTDGDVSIYFLRVGGKQKERLLFFFHESQILIQDAYSILGIPPTKFLKSIF